jgi:hypothetical protein
MMIRLRRFMGWGVGGRGGGEGVLIVDTGLDGMGRIR